MGFWKRFFGVNRKAVVVVNSGYFDPIHVGHIECMELSKRLGDKLVVIINNDEQCRLKKGKAFMPERERMKIVRSLSCVDGVFLSIDKDRSVCKSLEVIKPNIFAKGGDRTVGNIPEKEICERLNIKIIDGVGKKIQSSSELIAGGKK